MHECVQECYETCSVIIPASSPRPDGNVPPSSQGVERTWSLQSGQGQAHCICASLVAVDLALTYSAGITPSPPLATKGIHFRTGTARGRITGQVS